MVSVVRVVACVGCISQVTLFIHADGCIKGGGAKFALVHEAKNVHKFDFLVHFGCSVNFVQY